MSSTPSHHPASEHAPPQRRRHHRHHHHHQQQQQQEQQEQQERQEQQEQQPEFFWKRHSWWILPFFPAWLFWPLWCFTLTYGSHWQNVFHTYWPMTLAMMVGGFVAGSTPLGGGIVAFPVSVLVLNFTSHEGRDVSLLVQSVGMNAAAYLLCLTKSHLLLPEFILVFCITGVLGVVLGAALQPSSTVMNLVYTLLVINFALVFWYTNNIVHRSDAQTTTTKQQSLVAARFKGGVPNDTSQQQQEHHDDDVDDSDYKEQKENDDDDDLFAPCFYLSRHLMILAGLCGGLLTYSIGSGSDIMLFLYGIYGWNVLHPPSLRQREDCLTASSVLVMGVVSFVTSVLRAMSGFSKESLLCWAAMAWIVVLGAPLGSMVLRPSAIPHLRRLFYLLALLQFLLFASLKIRRDVHQWTIVILITLSVLMLLSFHYFHNRGRPIQRQGQELGAAQEQALVHPPASRPPSSQQSPPTSSTTRKQQEQQEQDGCSPLMGELL